MRIIPLAEAKTIGDSNYGLAITFGFALVVILLVLAAQFESVWSADHRDDHRAVRARLRRLCGVAHRRQPQHLQPDRARSCVVGIMAKNGILIVEFANQLRDRGLGVREAIEEACQHPPAPGADDHDRDRARRTCRW